MFNGNLKNKLNTLLVALSLLSFGIAYAYRIAIQPFRARNTWLSVVIGDAATDIASFAFIYIWTRKLSLALIPIISHLITGLPMIIGQLIKHKLFDLDNKHHLEIYQQGGSGNYPIKNREIQ